MGAVNEMEFHVLKAPIDILVKFEKQKKGKPMLINIYQEREKTTYEARQLVTPTPEQLKEYRGDFYSEELQVTYKLALKEGKLYFVHKNAPNSPLKPTLRDMFTIRRLNIHFTRDKEDKITAFTLNAGRVKNLRFDKK